MIWSRFKVPSARGNTRRAVIAKFASRPPRLSVHRDSSCRDCTGNFLQQVSIIVVLFEVEAAGIGVPTVAEREDIVYGEWADEIANIVEPPAHVMEVNILPDLVPNAKTEISDERVNIRAL